MNRDKKKKEKGSIQVYMLLGATGNKRWTFYFCVCEDHFGPLDLFFGIDVGEQV